MGLMVPASPRSAPLRRCQHPSFAQDNVANKTRSTLRSLSFDPSDTRHTLLPLLYTRRYAANTRGSRSSMPRLTRCGTVRSGTVSADAPLSFGPYVIRLRLLLLLYTRRHAAAACGSRSSTSRVICYDTGRSRTVSADARRSFDPSVTRCIRLPLPHTRR